MLSWMKLPRESAMGVRIRRHKGSWYVFIQHNGQRKAKHVGTRAAAEKVKREIEARLALGDLSCLSVTRKVPTFEEYANQWLETDAKRRCKSSTVDFYHDYQKRYILPRFGQTPLTSITRDAVKLFIVDLRKRGLARN